MNSNLVKNRSLLYSIYRKLMKLSFRTFFSENLDGVKSFEILLCKIKSSECVWRVHIRYGCILCRQSNLNYNKIYEIWKNCVIFPCSI
jgi:hypothetical protein